MKNTLSVLLALFFLSFTTLANAQQTISGIWNMGEDNTKIEIKENKGSYAGKILSSDNSKAKIGNLILKDVKSVDGKWKGKMYSPKRNEWFNAVLVPEGNQLLVTVGSGLKSKTLKWIKE